MAENRWLIKIGAAVLALMLLIAAFSLGVYVGRYGWGHGAVQLQPSAPRGGDAAQGLPLLAPGREPEVIGMLRRGSAAGIELATRDGPRWIELDSDTRALDMQGRTLGLRELQPGDILAVFGIFSGGDGQQLKATVIVRLPQGEPPQP